MAREWECRPRASRADEIQSLRGSVARLLNGCARRNAAWKVGNIGCVVVLRFLDHNRIAHTHPSLLQARLLENTIQSPGGQVIIRFARHRHSSRLAWVLELPVATLSVFQVPAVLA